jgi:uncharacterized protein (DUF1499 family)
MNAIAATRGQKLRDGVLTLGVALAVFLPVWFAVAALGSKLGLWSWTVGLVKMTRGIGLPLIGLAALAAVIGALFVVFVKPRKGYGALAIAWIIPLAAIGLLMNAMKTAQSVPPIHDISTDPANAPTFSKQVMDARGAKSNPVVVPRDTTLPFNPNRLSAWSGRTLVEIQKDAYPDIAPLIIAGQTPAQVFPKAEAALKAVGLTVGQADAATGRIEAVAETFWYGFKDDVVLVLTPSGANTRVDVRSVSRVGISDLGANAKRVQAILDAVRARAAP